MKNFKLILSLCFIALLASSDFAYGQVKFPPVDKSVCDISYFPKRGDEKQIKVTYGRPNKNGRAVFGKLVKYGKVWRTGANEATEIIFFTDVKIGGKKLAAGTYTFFTIPNKDTWTIIFNNKLHQWGAYGYKEKEDALRTEVKVELMDREVETFAITFDEIKGGTELILGWDKTLVRVPIYF